MSKELLEQIDSMIEGTPIDKHTLLEIQKELKKFELMRRMETTTVCWQDNEGNIYKEYYGDDSILYNLKENSIEIYGYEFLDGYRIEEYGNFWWFEGDK